MNFGDSGGICPFNVKVEVVLLALLFARRGDLVDRYLCVPFA